MKTNLTYIIDDDKIYTYLLSRQIKLNGFCEKLETFDNGELALTHLSMISATPEQLPDIILLDLNMPVIDGWQFLDAYTDFHIKKEIKIYIISSSIDEADHKKATAYPNVSGFFIKPMSTTDIRKILGQVNR